MNLSCVKNARRWFFLGDRQGLAFRLFSYFAITLILILSLQSIAEMALVRVLLHLPATVKTEMLDLAEQANKLLDNKDAEGKLDRNQLAEWEEAQSSYLFVLNDELEEVGTRIMHPHFKFKLRYLRPLDTILDKRVSKPVISLPLRPGYQLVVQFSDKEHPAHNFPYYFAAIQFIITSILLAIFSLLLARHLQQPLHRLQAASRSLAEGDFSIRASHQVGKSVTEFNQLAQDLDDMAEHIHQLIGKQKKLITDVSHELRTPLARHSLVLHLLRKRCPDDVSDLLDKLESQSSEMNNLVSEILEFSRLEHENVSVKLIPTQLESLCQIQVMQNEIDLKPQQSLNVELDNATAMVLADNRLCLRAIKNVLENAIKYAGDEATIDIRVCEQAEFVDIIIADNGIGIPLQQLERVFDPFVRIEQARNKQSGGYGLGLAIVKEAMLIMRGEAIAELNVNNGVTVKLRFPIP
ncbi:histidine kinase sensor domain-containing protein [Moritella sp. 24]|uniref:ATP-binding protein n=1 Tax=Moritella sp. 24 TaxID=2746230 RepID=UPI001BA6178E|nr:ATP-binding protein [Moritella sp. 24]QUM76124.1 histidine kinase sensor domain-containing protein [Moritella sp. 24]